MLLLVAGLVVFLGIHLVPAFPRLRHIVADSLGEGRYKGLFSLISAAGLVLIVIGFARAPASERVFAPFPAAITAAPYAMTLAFILFAAANMRGHIRHVLQHPMLIGLLIWSTVHLLANGDLRGCLLFGGFLAYAILDLVSAGHRHAVKAFTPSTRYDVMAIVGGGMVALGVMALHGWLFGVRVVSFGA